MAGGRIAGMLEAIMTIEIGNSTMIVMTGRHITADATTMINAGIMERPTGKMNFLFQRKIDTIHFQKTGEWRGGDIKLSLSSIKPA